MPLSIEDANVELQQALALPHAEVFHEVVAISELLCKAKHPDDMIAAWSQAAAASILALGISPAVMIHPDTLDRSRSALIFSAHDTELEGLWPDANLENLLEVTLGRAAIAWSSMPAGHWPHLQSIFVRRGPGVAAGLFTWLSRQQLPQLRTLHASACGMTGLDYRALLSSSFCAALRTVVLSDNALRGAEAASPPRLDDLRELAIARTGLGDAAIPTLLMSGLPALEILDVSGNALTVAGLRALASARLPRLESLALRGNDWSSAPIWDTLAAADWPRLRSLDVDADGGDPVELMRAAQLLERLETVNLSSCRLGSASVAALAGTAFERLTSLALPYNHVDPAAARALSTANLPGLAHLDLSVNPLGDDGLRALVAAPWWNGLRSLALVNAALGDDAIRVLTAHAPAGLERLALGSLDRFDPALINGLQAALPADARLI